MAVKYTNRAGATYYLRAGKTKTGKPRYFFSSNPNAKGELVEEMPDGFEIYEHPANAQVFFRKVRPQLISDLEKFLVEKSVKKLKRNSRYLVDCKDEYLTIYEAAVGIGNFGSQFEGALMMMAKSADRNYQPVMRFKLVNKDRRLFAAERFCFRGSIDDWIHLSGSESLQTLVKRYVKILGTDAFYDLPYG